MSELFEPILEDVHRMISDGWTRVRAINSEMVDYDIGLARSHDLKLKKVGEHWVLTTIDEIEKMPNKSYTIDGALFYAVIKAKKVMGWSYDKALDVKNRLGDMIIKASHAIMIHSHHNYLSDLNNDHRMDRRTMLKIIEKVIDKVTNDHQSD